MAPQKTIVLPFADPRFLRAIDDVALLASGLTASVDAAILAIAPPADPSVAGMAIVAWNQRLVACPRLAADLVAHPMFAPVTDALAIAADALFTRIGAERRADLDPAQLCLVTDGFAVILSVERPRADADCGWLLGLARSGSGAVTLRPSDAQGAWSLIAAEADTLR